MIDPASPRALVVDDEPMVCKVIHMMLERAGVDCRTTTDGHAVRGILTREAFDVAFVDLNMPGIDGIRLIEDLRDSGSSMDVVLMTGGMLQPHEQERLTEIGCVVLHKPFKSDEIVYVIERLRGRPAPTT